MGTELVALMEGHLQLQGAASDLPVGDLAHGVKAAGRVFEHLTVEASLDSATGSVPHDWVKIDLAMNRMELQPGGSLIEGERIPERLDRVNRVIDGIRGHTEVEIAVRSGLPTQEGIDTPAAGDPNEDTCPVKRIEDCYDF
jgi:hypothetical protein